MTFNTSKLNKVSAKQICDNFVKAHPDLLEGAVITKIEISGCQGSRRTDKIELSYGGDDITDQKSVSKSEVRWIDIKALSFKALSLVEFQHSVHGCVSAIAICGFCLSKEWRSFWKRHKKLNVNFKPVSRMWLITMTLIFRLRKIAVR